MNRFSSDLSRLYYLCGSSITISDISSILFPKYSTSWKNHQEYCIRSKPKLMSFKLYSRLCIMYLHILISISEEQMTEYRNKFI